MRGVADAQEPRPPPPFQAVDLHRQELDLLPIGELSDPIGERWQKARKRRAEGGKPGTLHRLRGVLGNHVAALPVRAPVDENQRSADVEPTHAGRRVVAPARKPEPQHVDGRAKAFDLKPGRAAHRGVPPIGPDDQVRPLFLVADPHPDRAAALEEHIGHRSAHAQRKMGRARRLAGQEIEEVPLRHHRDEAAARRKAAEVGEFQAVLAELRLDLGDAVVRQLEQPLEKAELRHDFKGGGMKRVAAEVAQEIRVLLEDQGADAGARKHEPEQHAGGPAAGDDHARRNAACRG